MSREPLAASTEALSLGKRRGRQQFLLGASEVGQVALPPPELPFETTMWHPEIVCECLNMAFVSVTESVTEGSEAGSGIRGLPLEGELIRIRARDSHWHPTVRTYSNCKTRPSCRQPGRSDRP